MIWLGTRRWGVGVEDGEGDFFDLEQNHSEAKKTLYSMPSIQTFPNMAVWHLWNLCNEGRDGGKMPSHEFSEAPITLAVQVTTFPVQGEQNYY